MKAAVTLALFSLAAVSAAENDVETFAAAGVEDLLDFQPKRDYYIDMRKLDCDLVGDSLSHALRRQFGWKG